MNDEKMNTKIKEDHENIMKLRKNNEFIKLQNELKNNNNEIDLLVYRLKFASESVKRSTNPQEQQNTIMDYCARLGDCTAKLINSVYSVANYVNHFGSGDLSKIGGEIARNSLNNSVVLEARGGLGEMYDRKTDVEQYRIAVQEVEVEKDKLRNMFKNNVKILKKIRAIDSKLIDPFLNGAFISNVPNVDDITAQLQNTKSELFELRENIERLQSGIKKAENISTFKTDDRKKNKRNKKALINASTDNEVNYAGPNKTIITRVPVSKIVSVTKEANPILDTLTNNKTNPETVKNNDDLEKEVKDEIQRVRGNNSDSDGVSQ